MAYVFSDWRLDPQEGEAIKSPNIGFNATFDQPAPNIGLQVPSWNMGPPPQVSTGLQAAQKVAGAVNPALGIGLKAASGLFSLIGGAGARGIRKQGIQGLRGMLGKPVFDPNAAYGFARRGTYADAQQLGGQYDRNFGLDTGRGAGMYGKAIVDRLASQSSGLYVDAEKAKADRDARIYQLLASYQG